MRAAGDSQDTLDEIEKRIDEVEVTAHGCGYSRLVDSKGRRIGIGRRMPGATEIIEEVRGEEAMYRLLSAIVHGHAWAHLRIGHTPVNAPAEQSRIGGVRTRQMEKTLLVPAIVTVGLSGVIAFGRPVWNLWTYEGRKLGPLVNVFEEVFDRLQASDNARFWRTLSP